jgi:hypothetical protein
MVREPTRRSICGLPSCEELEKPARAVAQRAHDALAGGAAKDEFGVRPVPELTDIEPGLDHALEVIGAEALEKEPSKQAEAALASEGGGEVDEVGISVGGDDDVGAVLDVAVDDTAGVDSLDDAPETVEELGRQLAVSEVGAAAALDVLDEEGVRVEATEESRHAGGAVKVSVYALLPTDEPGTEERAEQPAAGAVVLDDRTLAAVLDQQQVGAGGGGGADAAPNVMR